MKRLLSASAIALALSASQGQAQLVHYPIITHTGNVTIIDTGVHETFAGVTYDERLYIMGPWQGYNNPMVDSESAEWFPVASVTPPPPPTPPCLDCNPPPPCMDCGPPPPITPGVPEPSTWLMMLLGFVGLSVSAFRRKFVSASL